MGATSAYTGDVAEQSWSDGRSFGQFGRALPIAPLTTHSPKDPSVAPPPSTAGSEALDPHPAATKRRFEAATARPTNRANVMGRNRAPSTAFGQACDKKPRARLQPVVQRSRHVPNRPDRRRMLLLLQRV